MGLPRWAPFDIASAAVLLNGPRYGWSLGAVGFAIFLVQAVANSQSMLYRWLNAKPLYALGIISYSLYLYHPFANHLPHALRIVPVEIAFAIAMALGIVFHCGEAVPTVERPNEESLGGPY